MIILYCILVFLAGAAVRWRWPKAYDDCLLALLTAGLFLIYACASTANNRERLLFRLQAATRGRGHGSGPA